MQTSSEPGELWVILGLVSGKERWRVPINSRLSLTSSKEHILMVTFSLELAQQLYNSDQEYPVSFNDAWQWLEHSRKDNAKRHFLMCGFTEDVDYRLLKVEESAPSGGLTHREDIDLTVDCFKMWGMMTGTEKGKEIRKYFLQCEKQLKEILRQEIVEVKKQTLSITEKAQKNIDALLEQMANSTHDPLAVNRYANAIQTLNDTIHRNQKTSSPSVLEDISDVEEISLTDIQKFLTEYIKKTENPDYKLSAKKLYSAYVAYCKINKIRPKTQTAFGLEAVKMAEKTRTSKGIYYLGITFK